MMDSHFKTIAANSSAKTFDKQTLLTYFLFASALFGLWYVFRHTFVETLDHLLTGAAALQLGGISILAVKIYNYKTVAGISVKMMYIFVFSLIARLSSTLFFPGYLPEDGTADIFLYQLIEIASVLLACWVLYQIHGPCRPTYEQYSDKDSMPFWWAIFVVSVVLAIFTHSDANQNKVFDIIWMTSQYLDSISMLPQLFLISQVGSVERWTSHFVAWTIVSRILLSVFWTMLQMYHSFAETPFTVGMVISIVAQMVLSADYMYYFFKTYNRPDMTLGL